MVCRMTVFSLIPEKLLLWLVAQLIGNGRLSVLYCMALARRSREHRPCSWTAMVCVLLLLLLCPQKLQHAHQVLQLKLETKAKLHKQALAAAAKEQHQLEEQVDELQRQVEQKDKDARTNALAAKQAQRKLEEKKGSAAKAVAGVQAKVAEAVAAEAAKHKQLEDARVHLMLCIIRDDANSSSSSSSPAQQVKFTWHLATIHYSKVESADQGHVGVMLSVPAGMR